MPSDLSVIVHPHNRFIICNSINADRIVKYNFVNKKRLRVETDVEIQSFRSYFDIDQTRKTSVYKMENLMSTLPSNEDQPRTKETNNKQEATIGEHEEVKQVEVAGAASDPSKAINDPVAINDPMTINDPVMIREQRANQVAMASLISLGKQPRTWFSRSDWQNLCQLIYEMKSTGINLQVLRYESGKDKTIRFKVDHTAVIIDEVGTEEIVYGIIVDTKLQRMVSIGNTPNASMIRDIINQQIDTKEYIVKRHLNEDQNIMLKLMWILLKVLGMIRRDFRVNCVGITQSSLEGFDAGISRNSIFGVLAWPLSMRTRTLVLSTWRRVWRTFARTRVRYSFPQILHRYFWFRI